MRLSAHFGLLELVASPTAEARHILNAPDPQALGNLARLAAALEQVRAILGGAPLHINSGYRCPELNAAVGGNPHSYHQYGCAADLAPPAGLTVPQMMDTLAPATDIAYDLLLDEGTADGAHRWLHFQIPKPGETPRRLVRVATVDHVGGTITRTVAG